MLVGVLLFVLGIFLMIFVHELGHYLAAKRYGIKVDEFFLGFGPRIWSFRRGETEYGLKGIPLGGYVRIAGMNPYEEIAPEDRDRVFTAKPKRQRAVVLVAGAATHFVLAFLLLLGLFWFVGMPVDQPEVVRVVPRLNGEVSPAREVELQAGDVIVEIDGRPATYSRFSEYLTENAGEPVELVVRRGDELVMISAVPVLTEVEGERLGRLGVQIRPAEVRSGPLEGVVDAGSRLGGMAVDSFRGMALAFGPEGIGRIGEALFGGQERTVNDPVGVVGAGRLAGQIIEAGLIGAMLELFAFFNVFVGILNLLPLPPLDGGHLAVLGVEAVRGRPVDPRKLIPVSIVVAGFLILFTLSVLYLDIVEPIPNPFQ